MASAAASGSAPPAAAAARGEQAAPAPVPKRRRGSVAALVAGGAGEEDGTGAEQPAKRRRKSRAPGSAVTEAAASSAPAGLGTAGSAAAGLAPVAAAVAAPLPSATAAADAAGTRQQENNAESSPAGPNHEKKKEAPDILARLVDHHRCPITQQLLVDPVIAEDGHVYERRALEAWLMTKQSSPTTNKAMGQAVVPAHAVRQTVSELVDGGVLDAETTLNFFTDRSRIRTMRASMPGPDIAGAQSDIQRALELTMTAAQRSSCEFHMEVISKMRDLTDMVRRAQKLHQEVGSAFGQDFFAWVLQLGDAARAAVTSPPLRECQMTEWKPLPKGARVKVVDDANELHKLCERAPPGADAKVGWNAEMLGFAGHICIIQRVGDASHANYILRRESPPVGRDFSFPYDALFLVG